MKFFLVAYPEDNSSKNEFGLFLTESRDGVILEKEEIFELSEALSPIYVELIENISLKFSDKYLLPQDAMRVICRRALVPIIHCFFERLIRINKAVNYYSVKNFSAKQEQFLTPNTIEDFQIILDTDKFNQFIISFFADIFELKKCQTKFFEKTSNFCEKREIFKNHLFNISTNPLSLDRWMLLFSKFIRWVPAFGRFPTLSFANDERALHLRGFYFKHFKRMDNYWTYSHAKVNNLIRNSFFHTSLIETQSVLALLKKINFSQKQINSTLKLLIQFIKKAFPIQFMENLNINYIKSEEILRPFTHKAIISSSFLDTRSILIISAAKAKKFKIIGVQHGGHYGNFKDVSDILELEWPLVDQFITWGWKRLPNHLALKSVKTFVLPSPWLSERKIFWKSLAISNNKPFDLLWMPQMMKMHSASPRGASSVRLDVVQKFSKEMIDFVSLTSKEKIKIYCKPYNQLTTLLMKKTYQQLSQIGGSYFNYANNFDKGLHYDLINKAHLVLWDQPGTGFLECISSGIPTMILWRRLYCEEEEWCKKDFNELENVRIIHQTPNNLIKELKIFLRDPVLWMNNLSRKMAVRKFSDKYALTSNKWDKSWESYLMSLKNKIND